MHCISSGGRPLYLTQQPNVRRDNVYCDISSLLLGQVLFPWNGSIAAIGDMRNAKRPPMENDEKRLNIFTAFSYSHILDNEKALSLCTCFSGGQTHAF